MGKGNRCKTSLKKSNQNFGDGGLGKMMVNHRQLPLQAFDAMIGEVMSLSGQDLARSGLGEIVVDMIDLSSQEKKHFKDYISKSNDNSWMNIPISQLLEESKKSKQKVIVPKPVMEASIPKEEESKSKKVIVQKPIIETFHKDEDISDKIRKEFRNSMLRKLSPTVLKIDKIRQELEMETGIRYEYVFMKYDEKDEFCKD